MLYLYVRHVIFFNNCNKLLLLGTRRIDLPFRQVYTNARFIQTKEHNYFLFYPFPIISTSSLNKLNLHLCFFSLQYIDLETFFLIHKNTMQLLQIILTSFFASIIYCFSGIKNKDIEFVVYLLQEDIYSTL